MGTNQTTMQNPKDFVMGSAKIELLELGSYVDLGLAREISFNVEATPLEVQVDNGSRRKPIKGIASQTAACNFTLLSRNLNQLYKLRGKIDTYSTTAATSVVDAPQVTSSGDWRFKTPIDIIYPSTVSPTITIVGSVDGSLLEGTDFRVERKSGSDYEYTVVVEDSVNVTIEAQDLTMQVDYTPLATETLSTGGLTTQEDENIRLTNLTPCTADQADVNANPGLSLSVGDPIYRVRRITAYLGVVTNGLQYTFNDKDATDPVVVAPIEMSFTEDDTRTAGDQLYKEEKYIIAQ